jgi:DNA-binding Lrp family transcriptional regulator
MYRSPEQDAAFAGLTPEGRETKRDRLVRAVRAYGMLTREEMAEVTGIDINTVNARVRELVIGGILRRSGQVLRPNGDRGPADALMELGEAPPDERAERNWPEPWPEVRELVEARSPSGARTLMIERIAKLNWDIRIDPPEQRRERLLDIATLAILGLIEMDRQGAFPADGPEEPDDQEDMDAGSF